MFSGTDLLSGDGQLLAELTLYAEEETRAELERAARDRDARRQSGNVAGRRGRRR